MAVNKLRKFRTIDEVQAFLNGGIQGSKLQSAQGGGTPASLGVGVNNLVGTSLVFTTPAGSVVFTTAASAASGANPDPYTLLPKDIKAQIEAAIPSLLVTMLDGALIIGEVTPTNGVVLAAAAAGGFAVVTGTVDLNTLTYGAGGTLDGLTLVLKHNGGGSQTVTFVAPANRGAIVTQINAVVSPGIVASINGFNKLVLTSNDQGAGVSIQVVSGTSLAALGLTAATTNANTTNAANALLGFDAGNATTGKVYKPSVVSNAAPCWVWSYSGNDNMHNVYTYE